MASVAFISHPSSKEHNMGNSHPECPERLEAIETQLEKDGLFERLTRVIAKPATAEQLLRVQQSQYLDWVVEQSPVQGTSMLDPDTSMNPHTLDAAYHAAGAGVLAVDMIMRSEIERAICCMRPPGHHAESGRAMGFCLFNNIAVAAAHALEAWDLERVAVVDFDVHHGNGTEQMFESDARVLFCSSFQHPFYPGSSPTSQVDHIVKSPLAQGSGSAEFREAVTHQWLPALIAHQPQMIFVSAGFDAHRRDQMAGLNLVEEDYQWVTQILVELACQYSEGRLVSMLEGGYELHALAQSLSIHVAELLKSE